MIFLLLLYFFAMAFLIVGYSFESPRPAFMKVMAIMAFLAF